MLGDAFAAIESRLRRFESGAGPACLVEPAAAAELAALRTVIGWPAFAAIPPTAAIQQAVQAIALAGRFCWASSRELPRADRLDALLQATELFTAAYLVAPTSIPAQAAAVCAPLTGPGGLDHADLHNDALDMLDDGLARRDLAMVDQACWQLGAAVLAARGDPAEPYYLTSLAAGWQERFQLTGRGADIDNAITVGARAVGDPASAPDEQAGRLANYSAARRLRFELCGNRADLVAAVDTAREAAGLARAAQAGLSAGQTDPAQADAALFALRTSLSALLGALLISFDYGADRADLDEAVQAGWETVRLTAPGDPARAFHQANLAQAVLERFARFWAKDDLDEGVRLAAGAAAAVPAGHPAEGSCWLTLALGHVHQFGYDGQLGHLDAAISAGRRAVAAAPASHPGHPACLSNLGNALRRRYEHTGDSSALDEAIAVHRQAVQASPAGPNRPGYLNNLGNALRSRSGLANRGDDIRASVTALGEAVALAGRDDINRVGYVADLTLSLILAAERGVDPAALDVAIGMLDDEVRAIADTDPLRHIYLTALGNAWRARFDETGDADALQHAITSFQDAVQALPSWHPGHAENQASLGAVLLRRFEHTGDPDDGRAALTTCQQAATADAAPALTRALAARNWGQAAAGLADAGQAMAGHAAAVDLLDTVAWRGLRRGDQERQLGRFIALACDAAAWAITAGYPEQAVELLEQGRGVLLARSLDDRARGFDLVRIAPDLAGQLDRIDQALDELLTREDRPARPVDPAAVRHHLAELTSQRNALLDEIRGRDGLHDFLRRPAFASLRDAAADGPVVIVNVSHYRCDALIISSSGVTVTELPKLTGEDAVRQTAAFVAALEDPLARIPPGPRFTSVLAWLWDSLAAALLPDLRAATASADPGAGPRPRVWLCPTGPLTFLPLHAAGHHDQPGETLADQFILSYTPTLRLLQQGRQPGRPGRAPGPPLLVALPQTPGADDLDAAEREADRFAARFTDTRQLRGAAATAGGTLRALQDCPRWAHFACHGRQDISDPSEGHLVLYDGRLTVRDIGQLRLVGTELAFLSACETFRGGPQLADEAITLATAFRLAGYRHVVGTLWSIDDELAPDVADGVYDALRQSDGLALAADQTAAALDGAVRKLRTARPRAPWLWAPYVHIGP